MDNISKKEKKFFKQMIERIDQKTTLDLRIREVVFEYLKKSNEDLKIKISENEIYFKPEGEKSINGSDIDILLTLLNSIKKLKNMEYIHIYDNPHKNFCCNYTNSHNAIDWELEIRHEYNQEILDILNSSYCISEKFREFIKNKYKTEKKRENERNFYIAIVTIFISSLINLIIYLPEIFANIKKIYIKCIAHPNFIIFIFILLILIVEYFTDFKE